MDKHELRIGGIFYYCPCGWAREQVDIPDDVDATEDYGPHLTAMYYAHLPLQIDWHIGTNTISEPPFRA